MPATYLSPGVYIEEVDKGSKPIQGVPTSITAFVGFTTKAEQPRDDGLTTESILSKPKLIANWSQFEKHFGSYHADAYLPYAVRGFFDNGGSLCWVISVRTLGKPLAAQALLFAADGRDKTKQGQPTLLIHAKEGGPAGNKISVEIKEYSPNHPSVAKPTTQPQVPNPQKPRGGRPGDTSTGENKEGDTTLGSETPPVASGISEPVSSANSSQRLVMSSKKDDAKAGDTAFVLSVRNGNDLQDYIVNLDELPLWGETDRDPKDPSKTLHDGFKHGDQIKVWSLTKPKSGKITERLPMAVKEDLKLGSTRLDLDLIEDTALQQKVNTVDTEEEAGVFKTEALTLFNGNTVKRKGLGALDAIDNVNLICAPDIMMAYERKEISLDVVQGIQQSMLDHCKRTHYRFAILDAPRKVASPGVASGMIVEDILDWRVNQAGYDSMHGALYYQWLKIIDPLTSRPKFIPPCGHIAGIYARSDNERGVHKAPANEVVAGVIDVDTNVTRNEQDILNPQGINCIRKFPSRGIRVWGARTLSSDPAWRYINVRRLFNFVEESVELSTQWIVFEPNDQMLWAKVRRDINAFLRVVWRSGALFGTAPEQAFYVKCDDETNPSELRDIGQMICEIGMSPVKPAEFVIFRFSQWTAEANG